MPLDPQYVASLLRGMSHERFDANETLMFTRQLEHIMARTYDVEYDTLRARQLFPLNTEVDNAAETFTYRQYDVAGSAKIVDNYATDFPTVEIKGAEFTNKIRSLGDAYWYSIQDMRKAARAGLNLPDKKAVAARDMMEYKLEALSVSGETGTGIEKGFVNASNILTGQKTDAVWASEDAAGILLDVNKMQKGIFDATKGRYKGDTLLLGTSNYGLLATQARAPGFTDDSIMQFILKQSPWLKRIEHWPALDTADPDTGKELVMLYQRDSRVCELVIAQDFEQIPPQAKNMAFLVNCHMRIGGVVVYLPKAVYRLEDTVA